MTETFETLDWYDEPAYYDLIYAEDTETEADFLVELLAQHGRVRPHCGAPSVLEPACGSGRLIEALARRGFRVTGFDLNRAMLKAARSRLAQGGLSARLTVGELADIQTRSRFDLAHCLVSTFKYLLTEREARAHLAGVAAALKPGGLYVLGLHLTDYDTPANNETWHARQGDLRVECQVDDGPPDARRRTEPVRSRMTIRRGRDVRRFETEWRFRTYDRDQILRTLRSAPNLELCALHDFTYDVDLTQAPETMEFDTIFVLRKCE